MRIATQTKIVAALALIGLSGCVGVTPPTRYYQMFSMAPGEIAIAPPTRLLGVSPVDFPDYLDRQGIVTRVTDTRIAVADFDQWSEQLEVMFSNVLIEDLRRRIGGEHVAVLPDDRSLQPSIELDLSVLRFDVDSAGKIVLQTRWRLFDGRGDLLSTERTDLTEQASPGDYGSIVDGMSRAVEALAQTIVATLPQAVSKAPPGNERRPSS